MSAVAAITSRLPAPAWSTDPDALSPHLVEWRDRWRGTSPLLLLPRSTAEVVEMVGLCREAGLAIVPQGGNTGLVGGQTPQGEAVMSLRKMGRIESVNARTNALVAQAGATLVDVQRAARGADRLFPLSLASEGTATVGGLASTNAGGVHVVRFGTMRELVWGVEAVLADGSVFNGLSSLPKDNTGYDLSNLFVGAEGTLGIVTRVMLKLHPRPGHVQRVLAGVASPEAALELLEAARATGDLAMFEVFPRFGVELVCGHMGGRDPLDAPHPWYALVDWYVDTSDQGLEVAERVVGAGLEAGHVRDAVLAQSDTQAAQLLALRENLSEAQKWAGGSIKHDVSLPIDAIPEFLRRAGEVVERLVPSARPVPFGHFGDGNIHYNISQPIEADKAAFLARWEEVSDAVHDIVSDLDGSISAEHGIGTLKRDELARRASPAKMRLLRAVKAAFDPHNLFNPRVLLAPQAPAK